MGSGARDTGRAIGHPFFLKGNPSAITNTFDASLRRGAGAYAEAFCVDWTKRSISFFSRVAIGDVM